MRIIAPEEPENVGKEVAFKNCDPLTNCINEKTMHLKDNAKNTEVVVPIYDLMKYSDNYSKTSVSLWQNYGDEPVLSDAGAIRSFHVDDNNSALFKFKQKITGVTGADGTKDVKMMVPLKYLSDFGEMLLINCETNLILTWSEKCDVKATTFVLCSSCNSCNCLEN